MESVRLRSQALAEDSKLPTRVAVRAGHLDAAKGSAHAYLVFTTIEGAEAALKHNMQEVCGLSLEPFHGHVSRIHTADSECLLQCLGYLMLLSAERFNI